MSIAAKDFTIEDAHLLRREAGRWLRSLRESKGLSQREVAERVEIEYYTFVSQLETGRGRIPPDQFLKWADVLGIEPRKFVKSLMRFYDPVTYALLFPIESVEA